MEADLTLAAVGCLCQCGKSVRRKVEAVIEQAQKEVMPMRQSRRIKGGQRLY